MKIQVEDITIEALTAIVNRVCSSVKAEGFVLHSLEGDSDGVIAVRFRTRPETCRDQNKDGRQGRTHRLPTQIDAAKGSDSGSEETPELRSLESKSLLDHGLRRPVHSEGQQASLEVLEAAEPAQRNQG